MFVDFNIYFNNDLDAAHADWCKNSSGSNDKQIDIHILKNVEESEIEQLTSCQLHSFFFR